MPYVALKDFKLAPGKLAKKGELVPGADDWTYPVIKAHVDNEMMVKVVDEPLEPGRIIEDEEDKNDPAVNKHGKTRRNHRR